LTKGRNTFEGYQAKKQNDREQLITQYLEQLKTSRVKFQHVTGLAEMVASNISHQQQHPCNKATLLRNDRYKALLLTFMATHLGGGIKSLRLRNVGDEKAKALVTSAHLKVRNLDREVERLKVYVSHLEKNQSKSPITWPASEEHEVSQALHEMQLKYIKTCQALHGVLRHFVKSVAANADSRQILDMSKLRNNVIVDASFSEPFFEWLRQNNEIPGGSKA
jgi:hypothetical protein